MLVVTAPSIPLAPILHGNTNVASKRPKLSLQTSCLPVAFGNSTTALSLNQSATCSTSPTVRNTFKNAYDACRRTSSPKPPTDRNCSSTRDHKASKQEGSCAAAPGRHSHDELPYQLPLGIRGILRNSPHVASSLMRASLSAPAANGTGNSRRVLFPAKKRVNYRYPIDEEIKTVHFVARHSDLTSSDSSSSSSSSSYIYSSSDGESESDNSDSSSSSDSKDVATPTHSPGKRKKYTRNMRQIRAAGLRDRLPCADEEPETPQTPIKRRRKCHRQWRWTLGPITDGHVQDDEQLEAMTAPEEKEPPSLRESKDVQCAYATSILSRGNDVSSVSSRCE
ncbi:hypothetical protein PRK78_006288 [Emydomyces testavorans]|uniref:Uncharacterized protein n=1 Tax=Emydomyces testavorans TaxID=2070801 RepID=A0AAF0DPY5_9EURO|nr:hypothetical protein PRK78_006288 [Emydomyces testavorans]